MTRDPIVEEVRAARRKIFETCNEDLDTLLNRFQDHEKLDQERIISSTSEQKKQDSKGFNRVRTSKKTDDFLR